MALKRILLVGAFLCTFSSVFARSHSFHEQHDIGPDPPLDSNPVIVNFRFYKDGTFVRFCKGVHTRLATMKMLTMWILPAECWNTEKYETVSVTYGDNKIYNHFMDMKYPLSSFPIYIHPNFNKATKDHNIAVIKLYYHPSFLLTTLAEGYNFIDLPTESENIDGKALEFLYENAQSTSSRSYGISGKNAELIESIWCRIYHPWRLNRINHMCVSGWFKEGLFKVDTGTPLIYRDGDSFKLVGLATSVSPWSKFLPLPIEILRIQPYLEWLPGIKVKV